LFNNAIASFAKGIQFPDWEANLSKIFQ
jgi:hypothetical protein